MTANSHLTPHGHERPCFCDTCIGGTLWDLTTERGKLLQAAFGDRNYTPGLEHDLADELIAGIPAARRAAALQSLANDHICMNVLGVGGQLLDGRDARSYDASRQMSDILLAAIWEQGRGPQALRDLLTRDICFDCKAVRR
jgi:hypothetical protein